MNEYSKILFKLSLSVASSFSSCLAHRIRKRLRGLSEGKRKNTEDEENNTNNRWSLIGRWNIIGRLHDIRLSFFHRLEAATAYTLPSNISYHRNQVSTQVEGSFFLSFFSRVLHDSMTRYVGRLVHCSVGPSAIAFLAFTGGFCVTAPAQLLE